MTLWRLSQFKPTLLLVIIASFHVIFSAGCVSSQAKYRSAIRKEVYEWFYTHRSIEYNKAGGFKKDQEKKEAIQIRRIQKGLGEDWSFKYEDLKIHEITSEGTIFLYTYIFVKKDKTRIFTETYYFNLTSVLPLPLNESASEKCGNDIRSLYELNLWEGDFTDYMKLWFGLEISKDKQ